MNFRVEMIQKLDPTVSVRAVMNVADNRFRFFNDMTVENWAECIEAVNPAFNAEPAIAAYKKEREEAALAEILARYAA